jgi:hypothetical protein
MDLVKLGLGSLDRLSNTFGSRLAILGYTIWIHDILYLDIGIWKTQQWVRTVGRLAELP